MVKRVFASGSYGEALNIIGEYVNITDSREEKNIRHRTPGGGGSGIMRVGIIDADLLYRPRQRFPNLACMKISGFYKREGHRTELIQDYKEIRRYDRLFLFKVFTDTYVPNEILQLENLTYGGTGFYYDKAPPLPEEMEHGMPDYELYQDYIQGKMQPGKSKAAYKFIPITP